MNCVGSFSSDLFSPNFLHNSPITCLNSTWQGFTKGKVSNLTFQTAEICHPLYNETIHFETCSPKSPSRFVLISTFRSIFKILNTPPCCKLQPRPSYTTRPLRISLSPPPKKKNKNLQKIHASTQTGHFPWKFNEIRPKFPRTTVNRLLFASPEASLEASDSDCGCELGTCKVREEAEAVAPR